MIETKYQVAKYATLFGMCKLHTGVHHMYSQELATMYVL